ncbi:hypothetical protein CQA63_07705 [Helicobacter marmotae]|uniref:Uncharacterized protein n=1 Tax=Helicobacter marmotae TaxID=152490 RepID=A0A3D8I3D1_9HELI|nr:hypothetical protein CQA63_07705 [Helicobacter marmotae]
MYGEIIVSSAESKNNRFSPYGKILCPYRAGLSSCRGLYARNISIKPTRSSRPIISSKGELA